MAYLIEVKEKAINLRKIGYSLKEISEELKIAKSTSSIWLRNIELGKEALKRLTKLRILGQYKSLKIAADKRRKLHSVLNRESLANLNKIILTQEICQLLCALLFWCEGSKSSDTQVRFTNSDPKMIKTFLRLLRLSFKTSRQKFRALIHIHRYHNERKQKEFWSKITGIPLSQFHKSFKKINTMKRIRRGYQGCIAITYYDALIAKKLASLYNSFVQHLGA